MNAVYTDMAIGHSHLPAVSDTLAEKLPFPLFDAIRDFLDAYPLWRKALEDRGGIGKCIDISEDLVLWVANHYPESGCVPGDSEGGLTPEVWVCRSTACRSLGLGLRHAPAPIGNDRPLHSLRHRGGGGMSRSCGTCAACCVVLGVREGLDKPKPPGVPCPLLKACGGGCSIYANRPEDCRDYSCLWLLGHGPIEDRPDFLGAVYDHQTHPDNPKGIIIVRIHRAGAESSSRVRWTCGDLLRRGFWIGFSHPPLEGGPMVEDGPLYQKESELPW